MSWYIGLFSSSSDYEEYMDGFTDEMPAKFVKQPNWIQRQLARLLRVPGEIWTVNQPPPPIGYGFWCATNLHGNSYVGTSGGVPCIMFSVTQSGYGETASIFYDTYPVCEYPLKHVAVTMGDEIAIPLGEIFKCIRLNATKVEQAQRILNAIKGD